MRRALPLSLLLAVVATWPAVFDPTGALIGHPGNDVWNHVWGYWWVADELGKGRFPLHTDLLRFPGTSTLYFIDTFGAIATLPVQWLLGPVAAYNVAVFSSFVVASLGAYLFCQHVAAVRGGNGYFAGYFGAVAFTLSPHLAAQAYNGISETLTAGSLPLTSWAVIRLIERPTLRRATLAGALGGVGMLANWYYGLFAALGALILALATAAGRWERVNWRSIPGAAVVAAIVGALLVAPGLSAFARSLQGPDAIVNRDPEFVWKSLVGHNVTDLVSAFRPGHVYSPDLKLLHGEELLIVVYLGWSLIAAAALGFFTLRRWRDRAPWAIWIAFFFVMMLGPYLYVGGDFFTIDDRRVPLPFLAFFDAVPLFDRISHPFRFVVPVQLGLAALAGIGLSVRPARWTCAAIALCALESLALSPSPWPIARSSAEIPEYCEILRADPEPGAVLDLPMGLPNLERAIYNYWQTAHGRPSPYTLNDPNPEVLDRSHLMKALRVSEAGLLNQLPAQLGDLDLVVAGRSLADLGVRYVVMHERFYLRERAATSLDLLRMSLGKETVITQDGDHVWRLERPSNHRLAAAAP